MRIDSFVPLFVIFGVLALVLASVFVTRKLMIRRDRRSPIKQYMLRGPGHALRERIDELVWDSSTRRNMELSEPAELTHGRRW